MKLSKTQNLSPVTDFRILFFGLLFLVSSFLFGLSFLSALALLFFVGTLLFCWNSKLSFILGLFLLVIMPVFLIFDREIIVISLGVYAFSFLAIGIIGFVFEYNRLHGVFYPNFNPYFGVSFRKKKRQEIKEHLTKEPIKNIVYSYLRSYTVLIKIIILFIASIVLFSIQLPFLPATVLLVFLAVVFFNKQGIIVATIGLGLLVICAILLTIGWDLTARWMADYAFYFLLAGVLIEWKKYLCSKIK